MSFLSFGAQAAIEAQGFDVSREVSLPGVIDPLPPVAFGALARAQFLIHLDYHLNARIAQPAGGVLWRLDVVSTRNQILILADRKTAQYLAGVEDVSCDWRRAVFIQRSEDHISRVQFAQR